MHENIVDTFYFGLSYHFYDDLYLWVTTPCSLVGGYQSTCNIAWCHKTECHNFVTDLVARRPCSGKAIYVHSCFVG
jgi:hypothetical protein